MINNNILQKGAICIFDDERFCIIKSVYFLDLKNDYSEYILTDLITGEEELVSSQNPIITLSTLN